MSTKTQIAKQKRRKPKSGVNMSSLSLDDKDKFASLLKLMAQRFGGSADSYVLLLGYTNYPNLFSMKTSKEMVENPELILLEVELYKAYKNLPMKTKRAVPFAMWRETNPIYVDFLARQREEEEQEESSPLHDAIEEVMTEEPPVDEKEPENDILDELPPDETSSNTTHIEASIYQLRDALEKEDAVIEESIAYHNERMNHHAKELEKMHAKKKQTEHLIETMEKAWGILKED